MVSIIDDREEIVQLDKEFHEFWKEHEMPDPSSNKYLYMVKAFFFVKGFEKGVRISNEIYSGEVDNG